METPKTNSVPPLEAFLVIFVTFCLSVIIGVALILTVGEPPALVIGELLILVVPLVYLMLKRINIKTYVRIDFKPKYILLGVAFGGLLLLLNVVVSGLLTTVFGTSKAIEDSNALLTNLSGSTSGIIAVVASLSLAGVCEEFAFRGLLQNSLTRRFSFLPATIISAFVFGLFHFDPQLVYILAAFTSGLALGYIYHRWNYVTAAIAHSVMNIIVLIFLLLGL